MATPTYPSPGLAGMTPAQQDQLEQQLFRRTPSRPQARRAQSPLDLAPTVPSGLLAAGPAPGLLPGDHPPDRQSLPPAPAGAVPLPQPPPGMPAGPPPPLVGNVPAAAQGNFGVAKGRVPAFDPLTFLPSPLGPAVQAIANNQAGPPPPAAPPPPLPLAPLAQQSIDAGEGMRRAMDKMLAENAPSPSPFRTPPPIHSYYGSQYIPQTAVVYNDDQRRQLENWQTAEQEKVARRAVGIAALEKTPTVMEHLSRVKAAEVAAGAETNPAKSREAMRQAVYTQAWLKSGNAREAAQEADAAVAGLYPEPPPLPPAGAAAGAGQGGPPPPPLPPPKFSPEAVKKFLTDAAVVTAGKPGDDLKVDELGQALFKNQDFARAFSGGIAETLLKSGLPPEKVRERLEQDLIRLHNEVTFGGMPDWAELRRSGATGEGRYGDYTIRPTPRTPGFAIEGPGGGRWYPAWGYVNNPYQDFGPTLRESTKGRYQQTAPLLAALLKNVEGQMGQPAGALSRPSGR